MVQETENPETVSKAEEVQLVVFKLGKEEYAIEINDVREIIKMAKITSVPNAPSFVDGIINLRGKIAVVINLLKRFGTFDENNHKGTHIIISEVNQNSFGIVVDDVSEVLKMSKQDIKKAPGVIAAKIHADYIEGIGLLDKGERLLILLNINKILSEKELVEMAELTKDMQQKEQPKQEKPKPEMSEEQIQNKIKEHFQENKQKKE